MPSSQVKLQYFRALYQCALQPSSAYRNLQFAESSTRAEALQFALFGLGISALLMILQLGWVTSTLREPLQLALSRGRTCFTFVVSLAVFALISHIVARLFRGQGSFWSSVWCISRLHGLVFPLVTAILILCTLPIRLGYSSFWLVVPPLGVRVFEPLPPTTTAVAAAASVMAVQFTLFVAFYWFTSNAIGYVHGLGRARAMVVAAISGILLVLLQPALDFIARAIYAVLGPAVDLVLK